MAALHPSLWLLAILVALGVGLGRHLARGGAARRHWLALGGALGLLAATWLTPLESLGSQGVLTAHLLQLVLLMGLVPPLLLLAVPAGSDARGRRRMWRFASHPAVAMVAVNAAFFTIHAGPVFEAALRSQPLYDAAGLLQLGTAVLFWCPVISPGGRTRLSPVGRLFYILVATIPQTFAGLTVALTRHLVYPLPAGPPPSLLGMSPMDDQVLAGAMTAVLTKVALFTAFAVILVQVLNESSDDTDDGGWTRGGDGERPPIPGQPAWLGELEAGHLAAEPVPRRRSPVELTRRG